MEEAIDLKDLDGVGELDYQKIAKESFINVSKKIEYPPTALSIGNYSYGSQLMPISFGTYGNFSCLVGATKSMKTFLKSLFMGAYIGGNSTVLAPEIKTHRNDDKYVIDFDTEQGEWHAQKTFKRVGDIVGGDYENYKPFYLRKLPPKERLQFIEWCLLESSYRGKIGLASIDGFADLVTDVNDLTQSNSLTQKLLEWTDIGNFHLTGVLHKNFGTNKPTGHLGSSILKKAETVCMLDRRLNGESPTGFIDVSFPYTRGFSIDDFGFFINDNGLPEIEDVYGGQ